MVKHIVMWKIEGKEGKTKEEVLMKLKQALESLKGEIEGLVEIEVGINENHSETAFDAVLYSIFENQEALEYYQQHEKHQHVANTYVRPFTIERSVVDFHTV